MVPHRSTASTRPRLTALFGWEAVSRGDMAALARMAGIELLVNAKIRTKGKNSAPTHGAPMPTRHLTEDSACPRSSPLNVRAAGQDVPSGHRLDNDPRPTIGTRADCTLLCEFEKRFYGGPCSTLGAL